MIKLSVLASKEHLILRGVIVAFGNGGLAARAQFILANNYPDQNLSEDGLHWQWQTDLILGDDAELFENNLKRDELRYGDDIGKLAENDSSQDSVYVLRRQGYEEGQNTSDYPEYSKKAKEWEDLEEVAIIYGGYVRRTVDFKRYELKGHLGNVRVIVSDVKDATLGTQGGATAFAAIVEHYSHYYPFGMEKPSMVWDKGGYRYGFNGQEQVNEISGAANHNTALFWEFDMRTARRWNLDPIDKVSLSLYSSYSNNPIIYVDLNGDTDYYNKSGEWVGTDGQQNKIKVMVINDLIASEIKEHCQKTFTPYTTVVASSNFLSEKVLKEVVNVYTRTLANGGKREECSYIQKNVDEIITNKPGPEWKTCGTAPEGSSDPNDIKKYPKGQDIEATIHSHPFGVLQCGDDYDGQSCLRPSPTDKTTFEELKCNTNIIVGRLNEFNLGSFKQDNGNYDNKGNYIGMKPLDKCYDYRKIGFMIYDATSSNLKNLDKGGIEISSVLKMFSEEKSKAQTKYEKKSSSNK